MQDDACRYQIGDTQPAAIDQCPETPQATPGNIAIAGRVRDTDGREIPETPIGPTAVLLEPDTAPRFDECGADGYLFEGRSPGLCGKLRDSIGSKLVTVEWFESEDFARILDDTGQELPSVIAYWFAWYAFHPDTDVFRAGDPE